LVRISFWAVLPLAEQEGKLYGRKILKRLAWGKGVKKRNRGGPRADSFVLGLCNPPKDAGRPAQKAYARRQKEKKYSRWSVVSSWVGDGRRGEKGPGTKGQKQMDLKQECKKKGRRSKEKMVSATAKSDGFRQNDIRGKKAVQERKNGKSTKGKVEKARTVAGRKKKGEK